MVTRYSWLLRDKKYLHRRSYQKLLFLIFQKLPTNFESIEYIFLKKFTKLCKVLYEQNRSQNMFYLDKKNHNKHPEVYKENFKICQLVMLMNILLRFNFFLLDLNNCFTIWNLNEIKIWFWIFVFPNLKIFRHWVQRFRHTEVVTFQTLQP